MAKSDRSKGKKQEHAGAAPGEWLDALAGMGERGHPGEAIEELEPHLRDHLYDERAALTYARLLRQAAAVPGLPAGQAGWRGPVVGVARRRGTRRRGLAHHRDRDHAESR